MARTTINTTLGQSLGEGRYNTQAKSGQSASADLTTAQSAVTDLAALIVTSKTAVDLTKTDADAAAGTLSTDVADAVDALLEDGALPTQAHVDTLSTAWGLLEIAITLAATDAGLAKTANDLVTTTPVTTALTALDADDAADLVLDINASVITSGNALRAAVKAALQVAAGDSRFLN